MVPYVQVPGTLRAFEGSLITPRWRPGDLLWVRETWCPVDDSDFYLNEPVEWVDYRATPRYEASHPAGWHNEPDNPHALKWRPSIHMPRRASRFTLKVTDVRAQRLQDITEEDAKTEGLAEITKDGTLYKFGIPDRDGLPGTDDDGWPWADWCRDPRQAFAKLWNSIYGAGAWERNDWAWVTCFEPVEVARG